MSVQDQVLAELIYRCGDCGYQTWGVAAPARCPTCGGREFLGLSPIEWRERMREGALDGVPSPSQDAQDGRVSALWAAPPRRFNMDTGKGPRDDAEDRQPTPEEERRDQDQREQVEAQAAGDTTAELKAFAREVLADNVQFPKDIVEDSRHPERRVDEEQGTASQPGSEPAESRREK